MRQHGKDAAGGLCPSLRQQGICASMQGQVPMPPMCGLHCFPQYLIARSGSTESLHSHCSMPLHAARTSLGCVAAASSTRFRFTPSFLLPFWAFRFANTLLMSAMLHRSACAVLLCLGRAGTPVFTPQVAVGIKLGAIRKPGWRLHELPVVFDRLRAVALSFDIQEPRAQQ